MANSTTTNPITIDTTGAITTTRKNVQSVTIVGSTDAPVVVLNDADGVEIFRYVPAAATVRTQTLNIGPTSWKSITAATLTNVTRVFINLVSKV